MRKKRKKLAEQTLVITGATSGIGLATARLAAECGARLVLSSRNADDLRAVCDDLRQRGTECTWVVADVADPHQVQSIADAAIRRFGGFDTWVNNAAVSIYGRLLEVPLEDERRLFETNFWGVVHGCRVALNHLERKGGTIINIGSVLSNRSMLLQGTYSATKHAVKAYTDALRIELEKDDVPVSITLIKPGSIDTPYPEHARNYMDEAASLPPPLYTPEVVARAILACAERPRRDVVVGGLGGKTFILLEKIAPSLGDWLIRKAFGPMQRTSGKKHGEDGLYTAPILEGETRGHNRGLVFHHSAWTWVSLHRATTAAALGAVGVGALALARRRAIPGLMRPSAGA